MKYCCDCAYMNELANNNGLFKCENSRKSSYSLVSARMQACSSFLGAFYSKRGEGAREKMMKISRDHGYYIITALSEILGIPNPLIEYFVDFKMHTGVVHKDFFDEYDKYGPILQTYLLNDADNFYVASHLFVDYISSFMAYIDMNDYENAYKEYYAMFMYLCKQFKIKKQLGLIKK